MGRVRLPDPSQKRVIGSPQLQRGEGWVRVRAKEERQLKERKKGRVVRLLRSFRRNVKGKGRGDLTAERKVRIGPILN